MKQNKTKQKETIVLIITILFWYQSITTTLILPLSVLVVDCLLYALPLFLAESIAEHNKEWLNQTSEYNKIIHHVVEMFKPATTLYLDLKTYHRAPFFFFFVPQPPTFYSQNTTHIHLTRSFFHYPTDPPSIPPSPHIHTHTHRQGYLSDPQLLAIGGHLFPQVSTSIDVFASCFHQFKKKLCALLFATVQYPVVLLWSNVCM